MDISFMIGVAMVSWGLGMIFGIGAALISGGVGFIAYALLSAVAVARRMREGD